MLQVEVTLYAHRHGVLLLEECLVDACLGFSVCLTLLTLMFVSEGDSRGIVKMYVFV